MCVYICIDVSIKLYMINPSFLAEYFSFSLSKSTPLPTNQGRSTTRR